ncbi:MAG: PIN domain-containing protein [Anaerolineae bacterium]
MKRYVTDTQCLLWYLADDRRLPRPANRAFRSADDGTAQILVPSIALVEAIFLAQRKRVSDALLKRVLDLREDPDVSITVVALDMAVVRAVNDFGSAAVPELADRVIAATARALGLPLLTVDHEIAESGLVDVVGS